MSLSFLFYYFKFSYYLCYVPFRFVRLSDRRYAIHSYWLQKVLCAIFHSFGIFTYFCSVRYSISWMTTQTPIAYFRLFENILCILYKVFICKCIWLNQETLLDIVNFVLCNGFEPKIRSNNRKWITKYLLTAFFVFQTILAASRLINPTAYPLTYTDKSLNVDLLHKGAFTVWYTKLNAVSRDIFFQSDNISIAKTHFKSLDVTYSKWEIILSVLTFIALTCKYIMGIYTDMFLLMIVLTLYFPVNTFEQLFQDTSSSKLIVSTTKWAMSSVAVEKVEKIYQRNHLSNSVSNGSKEMTDFIIEECKLLRKLSKLINQCISSSLIPFIGEGIFTYAINLGDILLQGSFDQRLVVLSFYTVFLFILILSSLICIKVQGLKEWLYTHEHQLNLNTRQLTLLLDSLDNDNVGISTPGALTINFSLVGTLASALLTYFIIRLQYKEIN